MALNPILTDVTRQNLIPPHPDLTNSRWSSYKVSSRFEPLPLEHALILLDSSTEPPSINDLTCILQKCRKQRSLSAARHAHQLINEKNPAALEALGNYIVPMYVECGSMADAKEVFTGLRYPSEHSWTSLIQGYTTSGEWKCAFETFEKMQESDVAPNKHAFMATLRACVRSKSVTDCYKIHDAIAQEAHETDLFVGSSLVDMYAKQGLLTEARDVFDELGVRNVVSWTALIKGFVDSGRGEEALICLEKMQLDGIVPDPITYVSGLQACCLTRNVEKGCMLHTEVVKEEYNNDRFIGSTLVDMYVKCGMLADAQDVVASLRSRDVVVWTILLSGYSERGLEREALRCFEQMQDDGISPNAFAFTSFLKVCGSIRDIDRVRKLHVEIAKEGFESNIFIGSLLVDVYSKHCSLEDAQDVFDELSVRDAVVWTTLMTGYIDQGFNEEALRCMEQMEKEGICPDATTYVCSVKACTNLRNLSMGQRMHASIVRERLENNSFVASALLDMYAKGGWLLEARDVVDELPSPSVISWTALIDGYVEHGFEQEALMCFEEVQKEGMALDSITFVCILKACGSLKALERGQLMHVDVVREGFEENALVGSTLVYMYAKCGLLVEAHELFDQLVAPDVVSWTALATGYAEQGHGDEALHCFQQMQLDGVSPDQFSWDAVVAGHALQGDKENAFGVYAGMLEQGCLPSDVTFANILKACGTTVALVDGRRVHAQIHRPGGFKGHELILANVLIDMYCKCGATSSAEQVFDTVCKKDLVSWNTIIAGYGRQGEVGLALDVFERMRCDGVRPDDVTFLSVLSLCSHAGLIDECQRHFKAMSREYGITPNVKHHNCVVDLLGRAGHFNDLQDFIGRESFKSDIVTWSIVLRACHQWGCVELGRRAFDNISMLDERNGAAFTLMSNIYVDAGMLEDALKIEARRKELGVDAALNQQLG